MCIHRSDKPGPLRCRSLLGIARNDRGVGKDLSNQLQLRVSADTGSDPFGDSLSAFAFADPLIIVDPNFPGADKYSIVLSPGVGNGIASTYRDRQPFSAFGGHPGPVPTSRP